MELGMIIGLSVTCLFLFILYIDARVKVGKPQVRYVDTSGIINNPPRFSETWKNKTINFKLGKHSLKISHLPILENIDYISKIAGHFAVLKHGTDKTYTSPFASVEKQRIYQVHYVKIVDTLYKLGKAHNKKRGFKKAFYSHANSDSDFVLGICQEIFDYWQNMGKLLGVLAVGLTPRLVYGEPLGSDRLKWDEQGKRSITPRYDFIPKSKLRKMT